jgi:hydroxymethylglutaryl-CoA synthase
MIQKKDLLCDENGGLRKGFTMIEVGVSDIAIYVPPYCLAHEDLAVARGVPKEKYNIGLGNQKMAILPNWEDTVTMAANAALQVLEKSETDPEDIQQLVVSTESGVDHAKPVASFVQGLLKIGTRCRVYEVKNACYGGTAGLIDSIDRMSRSAKSPRKSLLIMTDTAQYGFGSPGEPTQGAGAVALLVGRNPRLCTVDPSLNGVFSKNVFDFWRPTGHRVPIVDGKLSIECYLMALEGAVSEFRSNAGIEPGKLMDHLDYVIYHMPFTNMAKKAHRRLIEIEYKGSDPERQEEIFTRTFSSKVAPGLTGVREVGNIYTGSVYMGLVSLLENEREKAEDKRIGLFSYGSGCTAEFLLYRTKPNLGEIIDSLHFKDQLGKRKKITFDEYTRFYSKSWEEDFDPPGETDSLKNEYTKFVFTGVKDHKRQYV